MTTEARRDAATAFAVVLILAAFVLVWLPLGLLGAGVTLLAWSLGGARS